MGHAYTPGLRVTARTTIRKRRLLPIPGEVTVRVGQRVEADTVIARASLPGKVHTENVVNRLGIVPSEIRAYMTKREGEPVEKGEVIAENRPWVRWFRTAVLSPITGVVENISEVTGQVLLRELPQPLLLSAYLDGTVVEVIPREGAVVETEGALVQGILGIGGEVTGLLQTAVKDPDEVLTPEKIRPEHAGVLLIGGSYVSGPTVARAREVGVRCLIVGGMDDADLAALLGYDLGVAITGTEQVGLTVILTEGFGRIGMAHRTFDLLTSRIGRKASVSGATQIRAGVIRPEVIIPSGDHVSAEAGAQATGSRGAGEGGGRAQRAGLAIGERLLLEFARGEADARIEAVRPGGRDGT